MARNSIESAAVPGAPGTVSPRVIVAARTRAVRAAPNAHWRKSSTRRMYSAALKLEDEGTPS
jgi:hypothetical protein